MRLCLSVSACHSADGRRQSSERCVRRCIHCTTRVAQGSIDHGRYYYCATLACFSMPKPPDLSLLSAWSKLILDASGGTIGTPVRVLGTIAWRCHCGGDTVMCVLVAYFELRTLVAPAVVVVVVVVVVSCRAQATNTDTQPSNRSGACATHSCTSNSVGANQNPTNPGRRFPTGLAARPWPKSSTSNTAARTRSTPTRSSRSSSRATWSTSSTPRSRSGTAAAGACAREGRPAPSLSSNICSGLFSLELVGVCVRSMLLKGCVSCGLCVKAVVLLGVPADFHICPVVCVAFRWTSWSKNWTTICVLRWLLTVPLLLFLRLVR